MVDAATGWPTAHWGTSPVGAPLGFAQGTPHRYVRLRANPAVASYDLNKYFSIEFSPYFLFADR